MPSLVAVADGRLVMAVLLIYRKMLGESIYHSVSEY